MQFNCRSRATHFLAGLAAVVATFFSTGAGATETIKLDSLTRTSSIAESYWFAHQQSRDGWTHELDLRPSAEAW